MIYVTKTFLPPQEEYNNILKSSWDKNWITNRGSLVIDLENKIKKKLNVNNVILTTNGTLPIQIAIKALELEGEIITTPFSYVATTSTIVWENCSPVFVDIHPEYLTIDEAKIEHAITEQTTAILATHVFGNPCEVDAIRKIANKYNLKVIYDAAHCFDVDYRGKSIFEYGDISTCSFHATKIFHTGEGGAMFTNNNELNDKLFYHHNFGHKGPEEFQGLGVNAKMSEINAAMGLAVLPYFEEIMASRENIIKVYREKLNSFKTLKIRNGTKWNFSYFPIILSSEEELITIREKLNENNIFPRRYFYPSLNKLPYITNQRCPISEDISKRILCLPLYHNLKIDDVNRICEIINSSV